VDLWIDIITSEADPMTDIIDSEADPMTEIIVIMATLTTDIIQSQDTGVHHRPHLNQHDRVALDRITLHFQSHTRQLNQQLT
jgi:hypothetical protein